MESEKKKKVKPLIQPVTSLDGNSWKNEFEKYCIMLTKPTDKYVKMIHL